MNQQELPLSGADHIIQCQGECDRHYYASPCQVAAMHRDGASCGTCDGPLWDATGGHAFPPRGGHP